MSSDRPRRSRGLAAGLCAGVALVSLVPVGLSASSQAATSVTATSATSAVSPASATTRRITPNRAREYVVKTINAVKNGYPDRAKPYATPNTISRLKYYKQQGYDILAPGSCSGEAIVSCTSQKMTTKTRLKAGTVKFQVRGSNTSKTVVFSVS